MSGPGFACIGARGGRARASGNARRTCALLLVACSSFGCGSDALATNTDDEIVSTREAAIVERATAPEAELSGVAAFRAPAADGAVALAVSDSGRRLVRLASDGRTVGTMSVTQAAWPDGVSGGAPQWEGIAVDGNGAIALLREQPTEIVVLSDTADTVTARVELDFPADWEFSADWKRDPNSRAEGFLILASGHVVLIKEKDPVLFIEMGPAGDAPVGVHADTLLASDAQFPAFPESTPYVPLKTWALGDKSGKTAGDLSDVAVGPDRRVYVLSDQARFIAIVEPRLRPDEGRVRFDATWKLPEAIAKPEGLTFLGDGAPIVVSDGDLSDEAVFVLEPLAVPDE